MRTRLPLRPRPPGARKKKKTPTSPPPERPSVTHGYVKSFDGTKLFYSTEGKGPALVFCYGLVCSSLHWTYQIEHFHSSYQTVWFDYRGHQNSEIPKDLSSLTLANIAQDLGRVLDELEITQAIFLGHSMGVNVVLEFYKQQPNRFKGMVLVNGTARRPLETLFDQSLFQSGFQMCKKLYEKSPRLFKLFWKSQKVNPFVRTMVSIGGFNPHLTPQADIELYIQQVLKMNPEILLFLMEDYNACDYTIWLHNVQVPTLVIAGEQDKMIPLPQQELVHQLIPGSQLEVIRHGSHCSQMDLPDLVNLRIEKFLKEIKYQVAAV